MDSVAVGPLWEARDSPEHEATDEKRLIETLVGRPVDDAKLRLQLLLHWATSWKSEQALRALAGSLNVLALDDKEEEEKALFCQCCATLAARADLQRPLLDVLFREETQRRLLACMERGPARREASTAVVKLCLHCLKDKAADRLLSSSIRRLLLPVKHLLEAKEADPQTVVNAAQIMAARAASQSYDKLREPDEVVLMVEAGLYDALGPHLVTQKNLRPPLMNAVSGLMVSPEAVTKQRPGALTEALKEIRRNDAAAGNVLDALELAEFKRVVAARAAEGGDKEMGEAFLGVMGAAGGPSSLGFAFSNPEIEKDFKQQAYREGVLKPMADKMRENGEAPLNVDNIASSVLKDFSAPRPGCAVGGCEKEGTKRCGRCRAVSYCSKDHQQQDWSHHKRTCEPKK